MTTNGLAAAAGLFLRGKGSADREPARRPARDVRRCRASSQRFSNCSGKAEATDASARHSPSGLETGFAGHPCPAIAGYPAEQQENPMFLRKTPEGIMRRPLSALRDINYLAACDKNGFAA